MPLGNMDHDAIVEVIECPPAMLTALLPDEPHQSLVLGIPDLCDVVSELLGGRVLDVIVHTKTAGH